MGDKEFKKDKQQCRVSLLSQSQCESIIHPELAAIFFFTYGSWLSSQKYGFDLERSSKVLIEILFRFNLKGCLVLFTLI